MPKFACKSKTTSAVVTRPSTARGAMLAKFNIRSAYGFNENRRPALIRNNHNLQCYMSAPYMNARIRPAAR